MKTILILILLTVNVFAQTANKTFTWDQNSEPDLAGYRVYWGLESKPQNQGKERPNKVEVKTNLATIPLPKGTMVFISVTAFNTNEDESEPSIEFPYYVKNDGEIRIPSPPSGTKAPKELNLTRVEKSNDLKIWTPVWFSVADKEFYRVVRAL